MKRRDFIKTVTAGVGGMSVLGANAAPAQKPLRVGVDRLRCPWSSCNPAEYRQLRDGRARCIR